MPNSKITDVIVNRLRSFSEIKEETSPIGHGSSMGTVREARMADMLRDYLPNDIGVETGFVCDVAGNISPQIDIVITDIDPIPTLDFDGHFKLVPVEKVICCIEVKSTLDQDALDQIEKQEKSIQSMSRLIGHASEGQAEMVPVLFAVFALDARVGKEKLERFVATNPVIRQVSVVGQHAFRNRSWEGYDVQECEGSSTFAETRMSIGWLLAMINDAQKFRSERFPVSNRRTVWQGYLGMDLQEVASLGNDV